MVNRRRLSLVRAIKHFFTAPWLVRKFLPSEHSAEIESRIAQAESLHSGEIIFAIEHALPVWKAFTGYSASERALDIFSNLRVWDTEQNNGVLLYFLLADRSFEIIADRGVARKIRQEELDKICRRIETKLSQNEFHEGLIEGIEELSKLMAQHFPPSVDDKNELPNRVEIL